MSDFTNVLPAQSYPDLLSLNNGGNIGAGMTLTLVNVQDGLGNNSPMQIATNAVNFNTTGGNTFQLNGVPFVGNSVSLNDLTSNNPNFSFATTAVAVPTGNTAQRPGAPVVGDFRYNSQTNVFEGYTNTGWRTFTVT